MAVITSSEIKVAEKSKRNSVKSLEEIILESTKKDARGFYLWADLIQGFEQHFRLTKVQAAIEIRKLINQGKLFLVPCYLTSDVALTRDNSILSSSVYATAKENKEFGELDAKYLKQLSQLDLEERIEERNRNRRNETLQRRYSKDREELLRKK